MYKLSFFDIKDDKITLIFQYKGNYMLLTRASEYALLSLILIARSNKPEGVDLLSTRLNISKSFLAKILQSLAKEGILKSYKGAKGGFVLDRKPEEIPIQLILEVVEKKHPLVFDCSPSMDSCPNNRAQFCMIWPFLNKLQTKIDEFLDNITLKDII